MIGFLNVNPPDAPVNQGLLDKYLALRWVQDAIDAFGGDPSSVTIFWCSAEGMRVDSPVLSPMSKRIFKRADVISGFTYFINFFYNAHKIIITKNKLAEVVGYAQSDRDLVSPPPPLVKFCSA